MKSKPNTYFNRNSSQPSEGCTIRDYYLDSLIATTNCSYVFLGKKVNSNEKKVIKFVKFIKENVERIEREVEIMRIVNHPNILKLEDSFRYDAYMCIITQYAPHHDLQQFIQNNYPNGVPEKIALKIFKQMLEAVDYLHKLNICHRDIKLENFLVFDSDIENPHIVLSDFGFSIQFQEDEKGEDFCGTLEYMAPEIYNYDPYDEKVDIWSLGISLYKLLTAKLPFVLSTKFPRELMQKIQSGDLNFSLLKEMKISKEAIDLVRKMCNTNPDKRMSAESSLSHCWIISQPMKKSKKRSSIKKSQKVQLIELTDM